MNAKKAQRLQALPLRLDGGLLLRHAVREDEDELAAFNVRVQSEDPDNPIHWIGEWTRDLLRGDHPTTGPNDFTVVVDPANHDKIVSSLVLISQTWRYEDVPFGVGRPELVGTDGGYRRRGLVRKQMQLAHEWSHARGQLAQVITGIPDYYRRFGYEMALNLGGSRLYPQDRLRKLKGPREGDLHVRRATVSDIPTLRRLYEIHCQSSLVSRVRDDAQWHYEMDDAHESTAYRRNFHIVASKRDGQVAGYFTLGTHPGHVTIREIAATPGCSLRAIALRAARFVHESCYDDENNDGQRRTLAFILGEEHPAYRALARELVPYSEPYGWYVRIPDLCTFLETVVPVLNRRLEGSVVAGHSGSMRINCTSEHIRLQFERGMLASLERYEPERYEEGDAYFPGRTFLQLLLGHRDLDELHKSYADCYVLNDEAYIVLTALFPRKASLPIGLG